MIFRGDLKKTIQRALQPELLEMTDDEIGEVADKVVEAIDFDHDDVVEDEEDYHDEDEDPIDEEMRLGNDD